MPCWKRFAIIPRREHTTHWELYLRRTAAQHAQSQLSKVHYGWNREIGRRTIILALRYWRRVIVAALPVNSRLRFGRNQTQLLLILRAGHCFRRQGTWMALRKSS